MQQRNILIKILFKWCYLQKKLINKYTEDYIYSSLKMEWKSRFVCDIIVLDTNLCFLNINYIHCKIYLIKIYILNSPTYGYD